MKILIVILSIVVFFGCAKKDKIVNNEDYAQSFFFEVIDTLTINQKGTLIKALDYNSSNDRILFGSSARLDTIVQTDSFGKVLNKFYFNGQDENSIGNFIHNIGYFQDTLIVVNSERGFYFYDLNGNLIKKIKNETPTKTIGGGKSFRIRENKKNGQNYLFASLKQSFDKKELKNFFNSNTVLHQYRFLTIFNLDSNTYDVKYGYEDESIFNMEEKHYGDPFALFEYNANNDALYLIHNPDSKIFKYNLGNNSNYEVINLYPENFNLPISYKLNQQWNTNKHFILNSEIKDINGFGNYLLVTYSSGIPRADYNNIESDAELPMLFNKKMKYYSVLLKNDKKISNDMSLPYGATGVGAFISMDYIILNTNPNITETNDGVVFYIAKIVSND